MNKQITSPIESTKLTPEKWEQQDDSGSVMHNEKCPTHKTENFTLFCVKHTETLCRKCDVSQHKSCKLVNLLQVNIDDEEIQYYKSNVHDLEEQLTSTENKIQINVDTNRSCKQLYLKELQQLRKEVNKKFDRLQQKCEKQCSETFEGNVKRLTQLRTFCKEQRKNVKELKEFTDNLLTQNHVKRLYVEVHKKQQDIRAIKKNLNILNRESNFNGYAFKRNSGIQALLNDKLFDIGGLEESCTGSDEIFEDTTCDPVMHVRFESRPTLCTSLSRLRDEQFGSSVQVLNLSQSDFFDSRAEASDAEILEREMLKPKMPFDHHRYEKLPRSYTEGRFGTKVLVEKVFTPPPPSPPPGIMTSLHCEMPSVKNMPNHYSENQLLASFSINGLHIVLNCGDLRQETSDAIVNPANGQLEHYGGLAYLLSKARGREMDEECRRFIRSNGNLKTTEVMHTSGGGALHTSNIIHAAGPMWLSDTYRGQFMSQLTQTFLNCFTYANNRLLIKSLALPTISTGVYKVPLDICVRCFLYAALLFTKLNPESERILADIRLVNNDAECTANSIVLVKQMLESSISALTAEAENIMATHAECRIENREERGEMIAEKGPLHSAELKDITKTEKGDLQTKKKKKKKDKKQN